MSNAFTIALYVVLIPLAIGVIAMPIMLLMKAAGGGLSNWKAGRNARAEAKWELLSDELEDCERNDHDWVGSTCTRCGVRRRGLG